MEAASFAVTPEGIAELLGFLSDGELVIDRIGIEGSSGLGQPLALALAASGYDVREVQPNRTAERRRRQRRAKTDIEDAEAIARETLADPDLPPAGKHAAPDTAWDELTAVHGWRSSLVLQRVRQLTEAEAVLVALPMGIRAELPATSRVLPQLEALEAIAGRLPEAASATLIHIDRLISVLDDIRRLTRRVKDLDKQVPALLAVLGCTLTEICGISVRSPPWSCWSRSETRAGPLPRPSSPAGAVPPRWPCPPERATVGPVATGSTAAEIARSTPYCTSCTSPKFGATTRPVPS